MAGRTREVIYSRGLAKHRQDTEEKVASFELTQSSQSSHFPVALIAAALNDPEVAVEYLGVERLGQADAHHVRVWKTFVTQPKLASSARASSREFWIDTNSGLPAKLTYEIRKGWGPVAAIPAEVRYSDYQPHGGLLFPHRIEKSLNGSAWGVFTIQSVAVDTGVASTEFTIQQEKPR